MLPYGTMQLPCPHDEIRKYQHSLPECQKCQGTPSRRQKHYMTELAVMCLKYRHYQILGSIASPAQLIPYQRKCARQLQQQGVEMGLQNSEFRN